MQPFTLVKQKAIESLIRNQPDKCIDVVAYAYRTLERQQAVNPSSVFLRFPERPTCRIISLPAFVGGDISVAGNKWIASVPANVERGLPRASAVLLLNDYATGFPIACLEGSVISAARTAASAALAARALGASRRGGRLAVIGAGVLSRWICWFLRADGWRFDSVAIHDLVTERSVRFAEDWQCETGQASDVCSDLDSAVRLADVVVFATSATTPHVLDASSFSKGALLLHISLRDLAPEIMLEAYNVVDDVNHAVSAMTSLHVTEQRVGHREFVHATLCELMDRNEPIAPEKLRIFSPFGMGVLDVALGKWIYDQVVGTSDAVAIPDFFQATAKGAFLAT